MDGDSEEPISKRGPRERTPVNVGQTGHQGNPGVTRHTWILLPDFPSSQGIGRLEANPELKAFNKFVVPPSFRMETLRTVMDCLGEAAQQRRNTSEHLRDSSLSETWAISIDLRDVYFHVAVAPEHTRYLRFAYNGRAFEFLVLPFGLSTAPRVFTSIVRVI